MVLLTGFLKYIHVHQSDFRTDPLPVSDAVRLAVKHLACTQRKSLLVVDTRCAFEILWKQPTCSCNMLRNEIWSLPNHITFSTFKEKRWEHAHLCKGLKAWKSSICQISKRLRWGMDEITCLGKMPSPNVVGPLSVLQLLGMDYNINKNLL